MSTSASGAQLLTFWDSLQHNDSSFYLGHIRTPIAQLVDGSSIPDPKTAVAVLAVHRYQTTGRTNDVLTSCQYLVESVSLDKDPHFAFFFHFAASQAMEEFERSSNLDFLDRSMDVLIPLLTFDQPDQNGHHLKMMVHVRYACLSLQYALSIDNEEPFQTASETFATARSNIILPEWASSNFGETRSLVFLTYAVSHFYNSSFPPNDISQYLRRVKKILDALPAIVENQYTAFQVLVLSLVLLLTEVLCEKELEEALDSLLVIIQTGANAQLAKVDTILGSLENAQSHTSRGVFCKLHMAHILDLSVFSNHAQYSTHEPQDYTSDWWYDEWEDARAYLRQRIRSLETPLESTKKIGQATFKVFAKIEHRIPSPGTTYLSTNEPGIHACTFKFVIVAASDHVAENNIHDSPHEAFLSLARKTIERLNYDQCQELVQKPETIPFSPHLSILEDSQPPVYWADQPLAWRRSRGIIALLVLHQTQFNRTPTTRDFLDAAGHTLSVQLSSEPGFASFVYFLATSLRSSEKNQEGLAFSGELFKEFLGIQLKGTIKHWIAVLDLATNITMQYFCAGGDGFANSNRRPELMAFAMELFRDGLELYNSNSLDEEWVFELKKKIIIGRVLQYRLKCFWSSETEATLRTSIDLISKLWNLLPPGAFFRASLLETLVISALIFLAQKAPTQRWHNAIQLLTLSLERRLNGENSSDFPSRNILKHPNIVAEDLFSLGIDPCSFNFASEAICLLHISDAIRTLATDCSKHPGFLKLSLEIYLRDLQLKSHPFDNGDLKMYYFLMDRWTDERDTLKAAVNQVVGDLIAGVSSIFEQASLTIYAYRATTTKPERAGSYSHHCALGFYPIWVSTIEPQEVDDEEKSSAKSVLCSNCAEASIGSNSKMCPWPHNLLSPNSQSEDSDLNFRVPSTILPFLHKLNANSSNSLLHHPVFSMPLSERTIQAFIRSLHTQIRFLDGELSDVTETLIRHNATATYWDPKDVLLGTRMKRLKEDTPFFAWLGPLQTLISRGPEKCLELVEVARSLFWSRLLRLRTPFDDLPLPDRLKQDLKQVTQELEQCKAQSDRVASDQDARKQYQLEWKFQHLLQDARTVPGLEKLLMPKDHQQLLKVATEGPVVMLIGGDSMYAALIIQQSGVGHIFLDKLTESSLDAMIVGLNKAMLVARGAIFPNEDSEIDDDESLEGSRGMRRSKKIILDYSDFLAQMWNFIVKPIFDFLHLSSVNTVRPRLWWCSTGKLAFIPIHAAGINFGLPTLESTSKYVVSSYTPTLSALMDARAHRLSHKPSSLSDDLKTLVLAQPTTKGHTDLPMTLKEVEVLEKIVPSEYLIKLGGESVPLVVGNINRSVSDATQRLSDISILHLACHGHQDREDPLNSGFQLEDGRLTISHLITESTPNALLAFMSACESASNDVSVPDESLNLAAAMMYAGFRSVIGTMWSMNDNDGPEVTQLVYQSIFQQVVATNKFDFDIIPRALDAAIQNLQRQGVHPSRWATYIHVGI